MKNAYIRILSFFMLFGSIAATAQNSPPVRGMYVNGFSTILGNTVKEDSLLHYAQDSSFNYLALYELHRLSLTTNSTNVTNLGNFIRKARTQYNITYIGAVSESLNFFQNTIVPYNNGRTDSYQKFNVFNVEFEFWSAASTGTGGYYCNQYLQPAGCNCDTSGAFKFYLNLIRKVDSLAALQNVVSETYLGWFNQGQAQQIQPSVDRILLHSYRTNETSLFSYAKTRLQYLAANHTPVNVIGLYSAEPVFMGPWLQTHAEQSAYTKYQTDFTNDVNTWKQYINLQGFQWFAYSHLPKPVASTFTASISAGGNTTFCEGGSVVLTATPGTSYAWSNGATTQSIVVTTSGSYTCLVTSGTASVRSNVITVTVNAVPALSITQGTITNGQMPLTAVVSSFNGSIASYNWYADTVSIANSNSSVYSASSTGNYSVSATTSEGCTATSSPVLVTIPVVVITPTIMPCTISVPTNLRATYIDGTTQLLSWNSIPSCDSMAIRLQEDKSGLVTMIYFPFQPSFSYTLSNLKLNKKYSWKIKTYCGATSGNYSSKSTFSTSGPSSARSQNTQTDEVFASTDLNVYPNPASIILNINLVSEDESYTQLEILDAKGMILKNENISLNEHETTVSQNISDLTDGFYILRLKNEHECKMIRFIKVN